MGLSGCGGGYRSKPPTYSDAIIRESSRKVSFAPCARVIICGGSTVWISMKFNRTPRRHILSDLRQFKHRPKASSHFKCLSRQVRQPVRVLFAFVSAISEDFLRFALEGRGELSFWLLGVLAVGSSPGDCDFDSDFACARVVRFILLAGILVTSLGYNPGFASVPRTHWC
jgi:hypothetical protein